MDKKCTVTIDGEKVLVAKGTKLADVLQAGGYRLAMPCGGKGICRKCKVIADGKEVLACKYIVAQDVQIILPKSDGGYYREGERVVAGDCRIAIDIGTTTVEIAVLDDKDEIATKVRFANPQTLYGADVISRIDYCRRNGAKRLNEILIDEINLQINKIGIDKRHVKRMDFAGNTIMTHLLLGEDCSSMGEYPYTPTFLKSVTTDAKKLGLDFDCEAHTLPCISAFVGGDTVAGLLTLPEPAKGKYSLYIDLGTNAEIVLLGNKSYTATSAPAGPCMEGANISCGMSAVNGAITHFEYPDKTEFLGDAPKGLCGSGLIDAVGQLYKAGIIDDGGDMPKDYKLADGVILKREDVRQYQLAKSAIRAAVEEILEYKKVDKRDVESVYLAGGFSAHTDVENAAASGLISGDLIAKCIALGNRSLEGCIKYFRQSARADEIVSLTEELDLNSRESFSEKFIKFMNFGI